jgi:hypothetical protein
VERGQSKTIRLEEVGSTSFQTYIHWLYRKEFDVYQDEECTTHRHRNYDSLQILFRTYFAGDFLRDELYCNAVTDELISYCVKHHVHPALETVLCYWPRLRRNSGLRRLVVDVVAMNIKEDEFDAAASEIPRDLLIEATRAWMKARDSEVEDLPWQREAGYYHDKTEEPDDEKPTAKGTASTL